MDYWTDEIAEFNWWANFQGFGLGDQRGFYGGPEGGGEVGAGCGAAFLALVFEGAADGVDGCVVWVGARVDEVVVFPACFADNAWIASIFAVGYVGGYFTV